jgi:hypothetical protein
MAIGTTAAIIGASVIGAGASIYGANKAAKGAKAGAAAIAKQNAKNEGYLRPYMSAGENALGKYNTALGLEGREAQQKFYDEFEHDPGWEAANKAGADTVDDRYRLSGSSGGNVRAALYDYGQRNLLSAYQTRLSQLGGLVDTGRSAATSLVGANSQGAAQQGGLLSQAGLLQGQGITGAGQALAGGLSNLGQYNMQQQYLAAGLNPGSLTANNANRYFG